MGIDSQEDEVLKQLALLLRARRERLRLSMNEVAMRSGMSHAMVLRVEKRERKPTVETLLRLARALEVDPAKLLAQAIRRA